MTHEETKSFAAKTIREELYARGLEARQVVLFGSQSGGNAGRDSDWDFLVSVNETLTFGDKTKLTTAIQRRLAQKHISADVIIKSEKAVSQEKNNVGVITYYALKHGIAV